MLFNYVVLCFYGTFILYAYCELLIFVHYIEYLARMRNLSDLIHILDDDVNVYFTHFTVDIDFWIVGVASIVDSFYCVPFTGLFLVIC